jgi:hypothetical protein
MTKRNEVEVRNRSSGGAADVAIRTARVSGFSEPVLGSFPYDHYLLTVYGPSVARR